MWRGGLKAIVPLLLMAAMVAGCGGDAASAEPREVAHEFGSTSVPASPERIVAIDEYAALDLLSVGIVPSVVYTTWGSEIGQDLLTEAGSELVDVGAGGIVGTEQILSQDPDLVVFTSIGDSTLFDQTSQAVPVLPFPTVGTPWEEKLVFIGEAFDRSEETDSITAALEGQFDEVRSALDGGSPSVSVLIHNSGILATTTGDAPSTPMLLDAGFEVPESQAATGTGFPYAPLSEELLASQDADVVLVFSEGVYDAEAVTGSPTFPSLTGDVIEVNGDMWFGTHSLAVFWMLSDLEVIASGDYASVALQADATARLDAYQRLVG